MMTWHKAVRIPSRDEDESGSRVAFVYDVVLLELNVEAEGYDVGPGDIEILGSTTRFEYVVCAGGGNAKVAHRLDPYLRSIDSLDISCLNRIAPAQARLKG